METVEPFNMDILSLDWVSLLLFEFEDNLTDSSVWNTGETGYMYTNMAVCLSENILN